MIALGFSGAINAFFHKTSFEIVKKRALPTAQRRD
jgi:hypothetical protein